MRSDLAGIWQETLKILEVEMTKVSFNTWLKPIRVDTEGEKLILAVPCEFNKEILETRYQSLIQNALREVASRDINFEIVLSIDGIEDHIKHKFETGSTEHRCFENLVIGKAVGKIRTEIDDIKDSLKNLEEQLKEIERIAMSEHDL